MVAIANTDVLRFWFPYLRFDSRTVHLLCWYLTLQRVALGSARNRRVFYVLYRDIVFLIVNTTQVLIVLPNWFLLRRNGIYQKVLKIEKYKYLRRFSTSKKKWRRSWHAFETNFSLICFLLWNLIKELKYVEHSIRGVGHLTNERYKDISKFSFGKWLLLKIFITWMYLSNFLLTFDLVRIPSLRSSLLDLISRC